MGPRPRPRANHTHTPFPFAAHYNGIKLNFKAVFSWRHLFTIINACVSSLAETARGAPSAHRHPLWPAVPSSPQQAHSQLCVLQGRSGSSISSDVKQSTVAMKQAAPGRLAEGLAQRGTAQGQTVYSNTPCGMAGGGPSHQAARPNRVFDKRTSCHRAGIQTGPLSSWVPATLPHPSRVAPCGAQVMSGVPGGPTLAPSTFIPCITCRSSSPGPLCTFCASLLIPPLPRAWVLLTTAAGG